MANSIVLLSGGMDSATLLAHALTGKPIPAAAVFINYGQRHIREAESAALVADNYALPLITLDLRGFGASVRSALTVEDMAVPHGHYTAANMAQTVVPNRNATMLSAAAGVAASIGATTVYTAVHAGDHAIYPDCRPEFIDAISTATKLGCGVEIVAPFVNITKADIAEYGAELGVPYHLTWSCYEGGQTHCGRCGTCVERRESFALARVPDPTEYADPDYWKIVVAEA